MKLKLLLEKKEGQYKKHIKSVMVYCKIYNVEYEHIRTYVHKNKILFFCFSIQRLSKFNINQINLKLASIFF